MKNISIMIKPASSMCQLRCRYCFYEELSEQRATACHGVMPKSIAKQTVSMIADGTKPGDQITIAFQGGEPTLAGLHWFSMFTEQIRAQCAGRKISYALQTNGIALNADWCAFLRDHHFLTGISLDLPKACHDLSRKDAAGSGTYERVLAQIRQLQEENVAFNVLSTLTQQAASHPRQVWDSIRRLGIRYIQFTPCLGPMHEAAHGFALTPERFASFYIQLFSDWLTAYRKGNYISVKLFDDLVHFLAFGVPTSCGLGGKCQPQLIIEADGSVYPCDFYCLDEHRLGSVDSSNLDDLLSRSMQAAFKQHTLPSRCAGCAYARFCGGGCQRMQQEVYTGGNDCGMKRFLDRWGNELAAIAMAERRHRLLRDSR